MEEGRGKELTAKILAIIMAVVLWLYVTNEQNPPVEASVTVPLEVRGVAEELVVADTPEAVRVKVRGPRSITAGLRPQDIVVYIDLKGVAAGRNPVKVYAAVPTSLELIEVQPDMVTVRIDAKASRSLPVEVRVTGTATAGTAVVQATIDPQQVTVHGPKNLVNAVDRAIVPLDLTGKNADFTVKVAPLLVGRDGKAVEGLTVQPDRVGISATLAKGLTKKTVDVKTSTFGDMAPGTVLRSITTNPAKVEVSGDPQVLEKLEFVYTEPISVAGVEKDTEKEIKLQIKEGVVASQDAVTVKINVGR